MDGVEFTFNPTYDYQGKAIVWDELGVAADIGGTWYRLTSNKDYVLSYRGNNKAGSASVVVKGKGNYTGTITQTFKIEAFDISAGTNTEKLSGTFTLNEDKTSKYFDGKPSDGGKNTMNYGMMKNVVYYDKSGAKPSISLRVNGNLMRPGKDYTISSKAP